MKELYSWELKLANNNKADFYINETMHISFPPQIKAKEPTKNNQQTPNSDYNTINKIKVRHKNQRISIVCSENWLYFIILSYMQEYI